MRPARIYPWRRMRRFRAASSGLDKFFAAQFSVGYITNMSGFDLRQAQDIFSIIQHNLVHAAEARTAAADAAPSCFRALGSRKPTNCTIFCGCNSFLPEPSVIGCDIGP